MRKIIIASVLVIALSALSQTDITWEVISDPGPMPEIVIPPADPPEGVTFEEPEDTSEFIGSRPPAPEVDMAAIRAGLEARSLAKMQAEHPPVYILDVTLPASRGAMERERLEDGHMMRAGRVYLKPRVIFDDPELRTPIIRVAPIARGIATATLTTVQEAEAAMDIDLVAHSMKTPEGELYIDITEIVNAMESGRIGTKLLLSPLSARESFTLPEPSDMGGMPGSEGGSGSPFEIVLTE